MIMNSPETNDPMETLLREQDVLIADNGFTKQVMARLPRRHHLLLRIIPLAVAVVGASVAGFCVPWKNLPPLDYTEFLSSNSNVLSAWLPILVLIVALASAATTALRKED